MTQVDFYILDQQVKGNRFTLACRIIEKAWRQGHRVLVQTQNNEQTLHMDRLLWTFRDVSFLPHCVYPAKNPELNPILINHQSVSTGEHDILVNLQTDVPTTFSQFARVAELIDSDPATKQAGRQRFKYYRDRGYPLNSHTIQT